MVVDLAMYVCLSVRMNAEIPETIKARLLLFGMQIPELLAQRKGAKHTLTPINRIKLWLLQL